MMKLTAVLIFLLTPSAHALDADVLRQIQDFKHYFDGGVRIPDKGFMPGLPAPDAHGRMPKVSPDGWQQTGPKFEAGAVQGNWGPYKDAFAGLESCQVVDLVYARQPAANEAIAALKPCLKSVSIAYGVQLKASAGDKHIILTVYGSVPQGNSIGQDLGHGIALRDGTLFGYPVKIQRGNADAAGTSSLQWAAERCDGIDKAATDEAFLKMLRGCLSTAKNLGITDVAVDPADPTTLIVYSKAAFDKVLDMNGVVAIQGLGRINRFRIKAQSELLPEQMLTNG